MEDQTPYFKGLGFKKHENKWGEYYAAPSGFCYRIDHFSNTYVIEDAETLIEAENNLFEDADLFDDDKPWEWIVHEIRVRLMEYEYVADGMLISEEKLLEFLCQADIEHLDNGKEEVYRKVAGEIMRSLKDSETIKYPVVMRVLQDVFERIFGRKHDLDELWHLSQNLMSGKVFPCPQCGKEYFWKDLIPDKCPDCGWEYYSPVK